MSEPNKIVFKIHRFKQQKSKSAQRQINHSQISNRIYLKNHNKQEISPIKKFQQYFGKVKPAFFRQLRNIFDKSQFQQQLSTVKDIHQDYNIKTMALTSRNRIFNRSKYGISESNNFTIEVFNQKDMYRKAKLNKLISCKQTIDENVNQQITRQKLRQSQQLIKQLKDKTPQTKSLNPNKIKINNTNTNHNHKKTNFEVLNPNNKQKFTSEDLTNILSYIHNLNFQMSSHFYYFNVYIEEGNNSDLLKNIVRKRTGWRIVQIPDNANLIWTQFYRKSILQKRLHKIDNIQLQDTKNKQKNPYSFRTKIFSMAKKFNYEKNQIQNKPNQYPSQNYSNQAKKLFTKSQIEEISITKPNLSKARKNLQITHNILLHNHFPQNNCISDKKNLLIHLKNYMQKKGKDVFEIIPESYQIISEKLEQKLIHRIQNYHYWLIKPGENSNRGRGIIITHNKHQTLQQINKKFNEDQNQKEKFKGKIKPKSLILQKYIIPFLYNNRKIDIRTYMLVTLINNQLRMYYYQQCYIRTSSKIFDINSSNKYVHLTNDAIQSNSNQYGKYQEGNKLSQTIFSKYIDEDHMRSKGNGISIWQKLKDQMKQRCIQVIQSSYQALTKDLHNERKAEIDSNEQQKYYFQLFGMDFMIDQSYKLWLIQVNTNPAITHDCSKILNNLIPRMLQNTLFLAVQPLMKPIRFYQINISNQYVALCKKSIK